MISVNREAIELDDEVQSFHWNDFPSWICPRWPKQTLPSSQKLLRVIQQLWIDRPVGSKQTPQQIITNPSEIRGMSGYLSTNLAMETPKFWDKCPFNKEEFPFPGPIARWSWKRLPTANGFRKLQCSSSIQMARWPLSSSLGGFLK